MTRTIVRKETAAEVTSFGGLILATNWTSTDVTQPSEKDWISHAVHYGRAYFKSR